MRHVTLAAALAVFAASCEVTSTPKGTDTPQSSAPTSSPPPDPAGSSPAPSSTATASPDASGQANTPPTLAGTWESPSCGERKYPRVITFDEAGKFSAEDRVSPCPPKVACVWSGIVSRSGAYAVAGTTITLTLEGPPASGPGSSPFPATLELAPTPIEIAGGLRCAYRQTTPEKK